MYLRSENLTAIHGEEGVDICSITWIRFKETMMLEVLYIAVSDSVVTSQTTPTTDMIVDIKVQIQNSIAYTKT